MMPQERLPYQLNFENSDTGMTSFSGLPLYIDMAMAVGLCAKICEKLKTKVRGWSDMQIIISLILLNLSGGDW